MFLNYYNKYSYLDTVIVAEDILSSITGMSKSFNSLIRVSRATSRATQTQSAFNYSYQTWTIITPIVIWYIICYKMYILP